MNLFGFFGPASSNQLQGLRDYARCQVDAAAAHLWHPSVAVCSAAWAPTIVTSAGISVALLGRPLARRGTGGDWFCPEDPASHVLEAYRSAGIDSLRRLDGRFSVAILDSDRPRAVLAIDPMGIERMTYSYADGCLAFGSSAEAVAKRPGTTARIDFDAVLDYLLLHMVPAPGTIFRGVRKLRPGYCAVFENGVAREIRYRPDVADEPGADLSRETLSRELHVALRSAVRDSGPSPLTGAFLSGGLDSSTVAGVLSEIGPRPTKTFTIGFGFPEYDEVRFARIANARFGCEAHEYVVTGDDIADGFPLIARAYDEPFGNSSALPVFHCARLARSHGIEHLLAGDGGDELFAGNSRYVEQRVFERYALVPQFVRKGVLEPALRAWPGALDFWLVRKARGYIEKAGVPLPARLEFWNFVLQQGASEVLHPDFRAAVDDGGTFRRMQELWDSSPSSDTLDRMLHYDWQYTLADNDLRKVETMSALAGVRVSYPMLHPAVVELSKRVPSEMKMPGGALRDFYKRAVSGFLPDEIIHKKKHGFGLPFGLWLQHSPRLRARIQENLAAFRSRRVVRSEFIDRLLSLHGQEDARYYGVFIWVLAMYEQWLQEHRIDL